MKTEDRIEVLLIMMNEIIVTVIKHLKVKTMILLHFLESVYFMITFIPFLKFSLISKGFQWFTYFAPKYGAKLAALIFNKTVGLREH